MSRARRLLPEALIAGLFLLLPLIAFWGSTVGGGTLIPTENLYQYPPFDAYRNVVSAPDRPHNALLSDLVLQNYQWKAFIKENLAQGEVPLWNPYQFGGIPFMAAGQQSTLYPLSIIYYVLPLTAAFGWFTVVNLFLAGWFTSFFVRGLGAAPVGGVLAGITYQLSGFFIASAVHPMIISAGVWLPLILLMVEFIVRRRPLLGRESPVPWLAIGAVAVAFNVLAGHPELTIYTLLIAGYYGAARLIWRYFQPGSERPLREVAVSGLWLLGMVALGLGLSAAQLIPLYEVASNNWRTERNSLETVLGFAHPARDLLSFLMPNFYGSPAHHSFFDWFSMTRVDVTTNALDQSINNTAWGIKNYVEGALYVGILPLVLAAFALIAPRRRGDDDPARSPFQRITWLLLTVVALTFAFGLPTYALIYPLPGINQLNTAFRWVYAVTLGIAVLAGLGAHALTTADDVTRRRARRFGWVVLGIGVLTLLGLLASRVFYDAVEPLVTHVFEGMVKAESAFPDARAFYSYQFTNALIFGGVTVFSGIVLLWAGRAREDAAPSRRYRWQIAAVGLLAVDLLVATWGFNPASDPALLDFTPPSVGWLQARQEADGPFRYTTLEAPNQGHDKLLQPNATMRYGLHDVRGYDSIIGADTVAYMRSIAPQPQLDFNRVAPLYLDDVEAGNVDWSRLAWLNVRYIVTHQGVTLPESLTTTSDPRRFTPRLTLAYENAVTKIYEFNGAMPDATLIEVREPGEPPTSHDDLSTVNTFDTDVTRINPREKEVTVDLQGSGTRWLIGSEQYADGWRAFVQPVGVDADGQRADEKSLPVAQVLGNLQGVRLNPDELAALWNVDALSESQRTSISDGRYTVRMIYSPTHFQVSFFGSAVSVALLAFLLGLWLWGLLVGDSENADSGVGKVARNSLAPIVLNLFNRGIDFAFAFVMLRILGPEDAGVYYYATVIFVWFDIFTNFGLDVFLIREASRKQGRATYYLANTTYLRFFLVFACIPLLIGFLVVRQATVTPQLDSEALLAIGLLYVGLAPSSINKGLTSVFYAFQKAEYPAAVTTVTTINKAVLGVIVLVLGFGIVGLASVSIVVNLITLGILTYTALGVIRRARRADEAAPGRKPDAGLMRGMVRESWPLMLNHFLATIFFQIDIVLLEALRGASIVGKYSVAYRWMLALNIVPSFFTQALLPVMSRQAREDRPALKRTYQLGVKILVGLAVPLAVVFTFLADTLTLLLGGAAFMPAGAIALQIMIWSIPIGWINSLTQYALIAVDLQRRITTAFVIAVAFNIGSNLLLIPAFGYRAAAVTTIFSEMVLLVPFSLLMHGAVGRIPWVGLVWRPVLAGTLMATVMLGTWMIAPMLALVTGPTVYAVALLALRPLEADEQAMLVPVVPARLRGLLSAASS